MTLSTPTDNRIRKQIQSTDMRPILAHWPASAPATVEAINTGEASTPLMGEWKRLGVNRLYLNDAIRLVGDKRVIIGQGEQNGLSYFVVRGFKDKGGPVVVIAGMRV